MMRGEPFFFYFFVQKWGGCGGGLWGGKTRGFLLGYSSWARFGGGVCFGGGEFFLGWVGWRGVFWGGTWVLCCFVIPFFFLGNKKNILGGGFFFWVCGGVSFGGWGGVGFFGGGGVFFFFCWAFFFLGFLFGLCSCGGFFFIFFVFVVLNISFLFFFVFFFNADQRFAVRRVHHCWLSADRPFFLAIP